MSSPPEQIPRWTVEITYHVEVKAPDVRQAVGLAQVMIEDGRAQGRRVICSQVDARGEDPP